MKSVPDPRCSAGGSGQATHCLVSIRFTVRLVRPSGVSSNRRRPAHYLASGINHDYGSEEWRSVQPLQRFVKAQEPVFEQVCPELRVGRNDSHWMWFIFLQLEGLGYSSMAVLRHLIAG